jgi:hypothetical protein
MTVRPEPDGVRAGGINADPSTGSSRSEKAAYKRAEYARLP